jgi:hypothetical protein
MKLSKNQKVKVLFWAALFTALFPVEVFGQAIMVFGLDETGSYDLRNKGINAGIRVIHGLKSGDVFYARRITENSYHDSCSLFRLTIPDTGKPPENKFDRIAHAEWQKRVKQAEAAKAKAINILSYLAPVKASRTDIWGFLAAAAVRLRAEDGGNGNIRKVIIASDMQDNVRRKTPLDLMGAEVAIVAFEAGINPNATMKLQTYWTEQLKASKAERIIFVPADSPYTFKR